MGKQKLFKNASLIISDEYKLVSFNEEARRFYPGISEGDYCYRATAKRDIPCLHCPIAGNTVGDCPVYYDAQLKAWKEASFTQLDDKTYGETIRPADWIEEQLYAICGGEHGLTMEEIQEGMDATGKLEKSNRYAGPVIKASQQLYYAIYFGDLKTNQFIQIFTKSYASHLFGEEGLVSDALRLMVEHLVSQESQDVMRAFNDVTTLAQRIGSKGMISQEYVGRHSGWTKANIIPVERDADGRTTQFIYAVQDIHDEKEAQQKAMEEQASKAALMDIVDSAEIGIWNIFYYNEQKPRMQANDMMQQILGIFGQELSEEATYEHWFSRVDEAEIEAVTKCVNNMMAGHRDEITYLWHHPELGDQYVRCGGTATAVPGSGYLLRGYHYDVTDTVSVEREKLEHDALTGLYTREAFFRYAQNMLDEHPEEEFDIVMTDIKNFKLINSTYGEETGDELLRFTAAYFEQLIGDGVCARYSADRFIGMIRSLGDEMPSVISSEIAEFEHASPIPEVKIKCGVYEKVDHSLSIPLMCDRAILALKSVKNNYNRDYAAFAGPVSQRQLRAQQYESSFKAAIAKKEFVVWFQPKYDPYTEEVVGAEALVRWKKADGTVIPPFEFLPVYEEDGLISQLDEYVFREVCSAQAAWKEQGRALIPISINLSRTSMQRSDLVSIYQAIAQEYELDAALIPIEITESAAVESLGVKPLADQFSDAGFKLHMDDLGSGRSSLNGLTLLHIDTIKLDKSLIDDIGDVHGDLVVKHLLEIGQELGLHSVAEGVEDEKQLAFLKENGCDVIQGYYFSKPLDPDTFRESVMEKR